MQPTDTKLPRPTPADEKTLSGAELEVLAKVRVIVRQITEQRAAMARNDAGRPPPRPAEDVPSRA